MTNRWNEIVLEFDVIDSDYAKQNTTWLPPTGGKRVDLIIFTTQVT
jgi:hypothetical protein